MTIGIWSKLCGYADAAGDAKAATERHSALESMKAIVWQLLPAHANVV